MSRSRFFHAGSLLAAALLAQTAYAQGRGGTAAPPPASSGNTGAGATAPGTTTTRPSTIPSQPTNPSPGVPQPIFLTGRVMLEDGTAPAESAVIERVCEGRTHAEGYTDGRGYFSIQLFQPNSGVLQDASEDAGRSPMGGMTGGGMTSAGGMGGGSMGASSGVSAQERMLMGCELRAKIAGFRSQSVMLANRRPMDPPDVGTILLHRLAPNEEGATISAVSLAAPKDARKAYDKGLDALKKKKFSDALVSFEKAVEAYPGYAAAWYEVGRIQAGTGDAAAPRHAFETAVKSDPKFVPPYLELSVIHLRAQKWQALADVTATAVKLDAFDYPEQFYYNAVANYYLQNFDAAEKSAREAERLDTRHQITQNAHLLGVLLAHKEDYNGAAEQLRTYLKLAPDASDAAKVREQLSQVEKAGAAAKQQ